MVAGHDVWVARETDQSHQGAQSPPPSHAVAWRYPTRSCDSAGALPPSTLVLPPVSPQGPLLERLVVHRVTRLKQVALFLTRHARRQLVDESGKHPLTIPASDALMLPSCHAKFNKNASQTTMLVSKMHQT